jgi:hypothetical protein
VVQARACKALYSGSIPLAASSVWLYIDAEDHFAAAMSGD